MENQAIIIQETIQGAEQHFYRSPAGISISKKASMVPLQMELGGKDVCIVCADADLNLAAKHIVKGGFSYSGQRCTAVKLVLADKKVGGAVQLRGSFSYTQILWSS